MTTRKRALLLIIRSKASCAFSSGKTSLREATPKSALKASVSSESLGVPLGHPRIRLRLPMSWTGLTWMGSGPPPPRTTSVPLRASPSTSLPVSWALGAVARMVLAPPSFCSAAAGSPASVSMYSCAPSSRASARLSPPRETATVRKPSLRADWIAGGVDASDHFMAGDPRIDHAREVPLLDEGVRVTDSASIDGDADLSSSRVGNGPLDELERRPRLGDLYRSHRPGHARLLPRRCLFLGCDPALQIADAALSGLQLGERGPERVADDSLFGAAGGLDRLQGSLHPLLGLEQTAFGLRALRSDQTGFHALPLSPAPRPPTV